MRGRKPTPTHLKLVQGNPGKRALNPYEPKVAPARPEPPDHLGESARQEWERVEQEMYRTGILTRLDRATLAAYCQAFERWRTAETTLAEMAARDALTHGLMIRTSNGNPIQNPLVGIANKAMADMVRYAAELGITPSARSRIHAEAQDHQDPAEEFFT